MWVALNTRLGARERREPGSTGFLFSLPGHHEVGRRFLSCPSTARVVIVSLIAVRKIPDKSNLRKQGFALAHNLRV